MKLEKFMIACGKIKFRSEHSLNELKEEAAAACARGELDQSWMDWILDIEVKVADENVPEKN